MTGHLTHSANLARQQDLHRAAIRARASRRASDRAQPREAIIGTCPAGSRAPSWSAALTSWRR